MNRQEIEKLALLARVDVPDGEKDALAMDMDAIVAYISEIQKVTGDAPEPEAGALRNVFRTDAGPHETGEFTERILAQAPDTEGGYIKVKKIL